MNFLARADTFSEKYGEIRQFQTDNSARIPSFAQMDTPVLRFWHSCGTDSAGGTTGRLRKFRSHAALEMKKFRKTTKNFKKTLEQVFTSRKKCGIL